MSVCWLVGWFVGRSVCRSLFPEREVLFYAPIRALAIDSQGRMRVKVDREEDGRDEGRGVQHPADQGADL